MATSPGVEDPVSAIFELSERAAAMGPVVRRLYRYTAVILVLWILIMAVVLLLSLASAGWLAVLALLGLGAGVIALGLLRQTDRFFTDFTRRYRWIQLVRDADPAQPVPEGRTPIERLTRHLAATNPRIEALLKSRPEAVEYRGGVTVGGTPVSFDLLLQAPAGALSRTFGWGSPGFAVLARVGPETPTLEDLQRLGADALAVAPQLTGRLARVILLRAGGPALAEPVYEYAIGHPIKVRWGREATPVCLEVVSEQPGGHYDLVPHVLGVP